MISLVGAHRTGKTTLAKAYAEKHGYRFLPTSMSSVYQDFGMSPNDPMNFDVRLTVQWALLQKMRAVYSSSKTESFVADRSPVDLIAYTALNIPRNLAPQQLDAYQVYRDACLKLLHDHLDLLILVHPGIPLVEDATKATADPVYIETLHNYMAGLLAGPNVNVSVRQIKPEILKLEDRVEEMHRLCLDSYKALMQSTRQTMTAH